MTAFGDRLREAREARNVGVDEIAGATHISRRYLHALERGDFDTLPGGIFDRGYIRTYAQYLGIDPEPILEAYAVEKRNRGVDAPESDPKMLSKLSRLVDERTGKANASSILRPLARWAAWILPMLALLAAGIWWLHSSPRAEVGVRERDPLTRGKRDAAPPSREPAPPAELPAAPPPPRAPLAEPTETLTIAESGVGSGVTDRRLVGENDEFSEGMKVWFWTRAVGGQKGDILRHVWIHEGRTVASRELTLGGAHWRTFSYRTLVSGSRGSWAVEARDAGGRVLAREEFHCRARADR